MERIRAQGEGTWRQVERGILAAVEEYQATGCATSDGNCAKEVLGIGTPLGSGRGLPLMAISVAGVADNFPVARLHEEIRPKLLDTVSEIERQLGQLFEKSPRRGN